MNKRISNAIITIFSVAVIITSIYSIVTSEDYFALNVSDTLTLGVTIGIAFWISNYRDDQRKMKEHVEGILSKIQETVTDNSFYSMPSNDPTGAIGTRISSTNKRLNNYINVLKSYGKMLNFEKDASYIEEQFVEYKNFMGEHIKDFDYLSKSGTVLKKFSDNIDSKCEYIILHFYS